MRVYSNWKLIVLQIGLLFLVMWIDNIWLDVIFMIYIIWESVALGISQSFTD